MNDLVTQYDTHEAVSKHKTLIFRDILPWNIYYYYPVPAYPAYYYYSYPAPAYYYYGVGSGGCCY